MDGALRGNLGTKLLGYGLRYAVMMAHPWRSPHWARPAVLEASFPIFVNKNEASQPAERSVLDAV